jgi:biotin operon repressor
MCQCHATMKSKLDDEEILRMLRNLEREINLIQAKVDDLRSKVLAHKPGAGKWWIGDETTTDELIAKVHACVEDRPRTLAELEELIGAKRSRISGAIVRLQVNGFPIKNLGSKYRAVWWMDKQDQSKH